MKHIEGITNRDMLRESGYGDDRIDAMLLRGELIAIRRDLFRTVGAPDDRRRRMIAGLLAVGAPVAVTNQDALWVRGLVDEPSGDVELLIEHPRNPWTPRGVHPTRTTRYPAEQIDRVGIIPVVPIPWAISDAGYRATMYTLAKLVTRGVGARWTTVDELAALLAVRSPFPGSRKLTKVVAALRGEITFSAAEAKVVARCRARGLRFEVNREIRRNGTIVARGDLVFADAKLVVEIDGPHHWLPEQAVRDRVRDRVLVALGWTVIRFSVYEVDEDVEDVVSQILAAATRDAAAA